MSKVPRWLYVALIFFLFLFMLVLLAPASTTDAVRRLIDPLPANATT